MLSRSAWDLKKRIETTSDGSRAEGTEGTAEAGGESIKVKKRRQTSGAELMGIYAGGIGFGRGVLGESMSHFWAVGGQVELVVDGGKGERGKQVDWNYGQSVSRECFEERIFFFVNF